jgi:hypothetical protein
MTTPDTYRPFVRFLKSQNFWRNTSWALLQMRDPKLPPLSGGNLIRGFFQPQA